MSRATRAAIWSRVKRFMSSLPFEIRPRRRGTASIAPAPAISHDALHEDARRDDRFGIEFAEVHDLAHLRDRALRPPIAMMGPKLRAVLR